MMLVTNKDNLFQLKNIFFVARRERPMTVKLKILKSNRNWNLAMP